MALRAAPARSRPRRARRAVADLDGGVAAADGRLSSAACSSGPLGVERLGRRRRRRRRRRRARPAAAAAAELLVAAAAERAREHVAAVGVLVDVGGEVVARVADLRRRVVAVELAVLVAVAR